MCRHSAQQQSYHIWLSFHLVAILSRTALPDCYPSPGILVSASLASTWSGARIKDVRACGHMGRLNRVVSECSREGLGRKIVFLSLFVLLLCKHSFGLPVAAASVPAGCLGQWLRSVYSLSCFHPAKTPNALRSLVQKQHTLSESVKAVFHHRLYVTVHTVTHCNIGSLHVGRSHLFMN